MTTQVNNKNERIGKKKTSKRKNSSHNRSIKKSKKDDTINEEFTLIKDIKPVEKVQIGRVLPHWLLHPIPLSRDLKSSTTSPLEACHFLLPNLMGELKKNKIKHLFPVQEALISQIIKEANANENRFLPRDVCVASPTGSGKTLAYVLPIVQVLQRQVTFPAIGALVILPVIELAKQVHKVFSTYASVLNLKVGQAYGDESFALEQKKLVKIIYGGHQSQVHILVATPGRLLDHISKTPGLDFKHLRFFVLDEADKLMTGEAGEMTLRIQNYVNQFKHEKVNLGLSPFFPLQETISTDLPVHPIKSTTETLHFRSTLFDENYGENGRFSTLTKHFAKQIINLDNSDNKLKQDEFFRVPLPPLKRLLFSATLSHDPEKLQNVSLYRPILYTTDMSARTDSLHPIKTVIGESAPIRPTELAEEYIKVDLSLKPLMLHYLLRKERKKNTNFKALVFAGSIELTSKIAVLLRTLSNAKYNVQEFSSKLSDRKSVINKFLKGEINVLVSSDAMARGFDVPNVDCVISYDVPSALTYVHRIGRTARAGNPGTAVSLITDTELPTFKKILSESFNQVKENEIPKEKLEKFGESFASALEALSKAVKFQGKKGKQIKRTFKKKNKFSKSSR